MLPVAALAANFAAGVGKGVGDAISGAGDTGPNLSGSSADARSFFDGSGWTVSTGTGRATGATITREGDPFGPTTLQTAGFGGAGGTWTNVAMLAIMGVVAVKLLRKR